jgi:hypothetical protein
MVSYCRGDANELKYELSPIEKGALWDHTTIGCFGLQNSLRSICSQLGFSLSNSSKSLNKKTRNIDVFFILRIDLLRKAFFATEVEEFLEAFATGLMDEIFDGIVFCFFFFLSIFENYFVPV